MDLQRVVSDQAALIETQRAENETLRAENAELKAEIAALKKNSSTSSKPPSSDIVKPPKPRKDKERRRKIGAQQGHKQHLRKPISKGNVAFPIPSPTS